MQLQVATRPIADDAAKKSTKAETLHHREMNFLRFKTVI